LTSRPPHSPTAAWILASPEASSLALWGLSPQERLRREALRAGCSPIEIVPPAETPPTPERGGVVVLSADWIYDERLVAGLAAAPDTALLSPCGERCAAAHVAAERAAQAVAALRRAEAPVPPGLRALRPAELAPAWTPKLRKSEPPFLLPARAAERACPRARPCARRSRPAPSPPPTRAPPTSSPSGCGRGPRAR
jgi:hypothetical protein